MIDSITGVVLAGGKSSRMGRSKALLPFKGKPLVELCLARLSEIFSRVILSVNQDDAFSHLTTERIVDRYVETGPMGGIASVLESGQAKIFCAACDMPFLNKSLIEYLSTFADCDAVIPVWKGRPEVLHAIYSNTVLPSFQSALHQSRFRIMDALMESNIRYVHEEEIRRMDPQGLSFQNVNTPADYDQLLNF